MVAAKSCSNTDFPEDNMFAEGSSGGDFDTYVCGKYFSVKCVEKDGVCKTTEPINIKIVDTCGICSSYAFQLSQEAFEKLADFKTKYPIDVEFSGPFDSNSSYISYPLSLSLLANLEMEVPNVASPPDSPNQDVGSPPDSSKEKRKKKFPLGGVLGGLCAACAALGVILWALLFRHPPDVDLSQYKPPDIHQVNDHMYELFSFAQRRTRTTVNPEVDIVLFHGPARDQESSDEAFWQNWMTNDGQFFPQFLVEDFPNCRIHSVSYNARVDSREGQLDHFLLAENLQSDIVSCNSPGIGQTCPVLLIGHSTGGNVLTRFILELVRNPEVREYQNFLHNLRGILYFSTPHRGMKLEALLVSMGAHSLKPTGPIYQPMNQLNERLVRLTEEMTRWLKQSGSHVNIVSVWEGPLQEFRIVVVSTMTTSGAFRSLRKDLQEI
ncbi:hypothetical protein R1sor_012332 [Riccia sorocarpa]|uniref:RlpA-like protein double-psi beta-barrel domain-containing protein n=1 Tax=Riccia sorocarpa TaxID=122646 RepID=A0ABD3I492_9MARC